MPTFQYVRSLIAQFQEEVYQKTGISTVLPHLIECLDTEKDLAVQCLRVGRVRLTFRDPKTCNDVLRTERDFDELPVRLTPADKRPRTAYLRDRPAEVNNDVVSSFFLEYGEVLSVGHGYFDDFPTIRNDNRLSRRFLALFE